MSQQDPPIVVTGGSITIDYDTEIFKPNGNGKPSNANKKITSVEVAVEGETPYTVNVPNGKVVVTIIYGNSRT